MSSPRKFSEKIALHKKKLAEETAAFEAVLREVSATTKAALEKQQKLPPQIQHLAQPSMAVFRGGSLPNVSEMTSSNSIDLQSALLCLEDMKQGCGRQSLIDKFHRDRNRHMPSSQNQRKRSPMEKRADCSPYGLTYLSPPPDTSWRRTNSDSAIHSSAVGLPQSPQQQHSPPSPTSPVNQHDVLSLSDIHKGIDIWNLENLSCHSRTRDAPGISLYRSSLDETSLLSPISSNSADPMQDLAGLQFTSSLCGSLLDGSDQGYVTGGHSDIAGQHARHIGPVRTGQQNISGTRHHQSHGSPSPLVLYSSSPTHSGIHGIVPQDSSVEANTSRVAICDRLCCGTKLNRSSCRSANNAWTDFGDSRGLRNRDARCTRLRPPKITVAEVRENGLVQHSCYDFDDDVRDDGEIGDRVLDRNMPYGDLYRFFGASKSAANCEACVVGAGSYLMSNASGLKRPNNSRSGFQMCSDFKSPVDSLSQYRNSSDCPQSPTSPLSQHSHSPSDSPGLPNCTISSSPFSDIYALQQQQQQQQTMAQANLLQQHFEQFAMLQDSPLPPGRSSSLYRLLGQQTQSYPLPVSAGLNFGHPVLLSPGKSDQSMDVNPSVHQFTPDLYYQQLSSHPPYSGVSGSPGSFNYLAASPTRPRFAVPKSSDQAKSGNKIPDIILTGVDDGHCHVDQFGNGMLLGLKEPFDMELFSIDDALRIGLNPLELEELQMLTNPTVVADPATEDSFRLDQL